ncbi:hypothetical protein JCM19046_4732 [Bacillus sp. JCM 19046]|nr:hypothetical protein JCM19045_3036 [Bacillus sp. JCM 19045]GAF20031.1 hypothetical protein JCM19046_4732 [Bacillus sp. JCM 19046]
MTKKWPSHTQESSITKKRSIENLFLMEGEKEKRCSSIFLSAHAISSIIKILLSNIMEFQNHI